MKREKQLLYRRENKRALNYRSNHPGSEFRYERNTKEMNNFEGTHKSIKKTHAGHDYTPLFMFLLSKVGKPWDEVHSEAVSRLDKQEPIFWMVNLEIDENTSGTVRIGEASQYSRLTVKDGILVFVNKDEQPYAASCTCCTHSFNGKPFKRLSKSFVDDLKRYEARPKEEPIDYDKLLREGKKKKIEEITTFQE